MATSSTGFQSILDAALDGYHKQTGINLINHPSAEQLHNCRSPDDVVKLLLERESAFKDYRDKYRKLIDCLRPVVKVIHAFSTIFSGASCLVSNQRQIFLLDHAFTPPYRCHFNQRLRFSPPLMFSSQYVSPFPLSFLRSISTRIRQLSTSVQAMMPLVTFSNASRISLNASISILRRSRHSLRCQISW